MRTTTVVLVCRALLNKEVDAVSTVKEIVGFPLHTDCTHHCMQGAATQDPTCSTWWHCPSPSSPKFMKIPKILWLDGQGKAQRNDCLACISVCSLLSVVKAAGVLPTQYSLGSSNKSRSRNKYTLVLPRFRTVRQHDNEGEKLHAKETCVCIRQIHHLQSLDSQSQLVSFYGSFHAPKSGIASTKPTIPPYFKNKDPVPNSFSTLPAG